MAREVKVAQQPLQQFVREIFVSAGMSLEDAEKEAAVLIWANLRGVDSHGVLRIPWYIENIDKGVMNPKPDIKIEKETPATMLIEADRALGPVVTIFAMEQVIKKALNVGIGWGLIRTVTHQGALGYYTQMATEVGMAGIAFTCYPPNMAPYGARTAGVPNSPLTIAVPANKYRAVILDMATSVVALGKLLLAIDKGASIPEGWAIDKEGNPTTDPKLAATLMPMGGPKGSGLAFMLECLSSVMAGNPLVETELLGKDLPPEPKQEAKSIGTRPQTEPRHIQNSVVVAVDIATFTNVIDYKEHIDHLIDGLKALPKASGFHEIFFPGEPEQRTFNERSISGIPLPEGTVNNLRSVAERFGIGMPQML